MATSSPASLGPRSMAQCTAHEGDGSSSSGSDESIIVADSDINVTECCTDEALDTLWGSKYRKQGNRRTAWLEYHDDSEAVSQRLPIDTAALKKLTAEETDYLRRSAYTEAAFSQGIFTEGDVNISDFEGATQVPQMLKARIRSHFEIKRSRQIDDSQEKSAAQIADLAASLASRRPLDRQGNRNELCYLVSRGDDDAPAIDDWSALHTSLKYEVGSKLLTTLLVPIPDEPPETRDERVSAATRGAIKQVSTLMRNHYKGRSADDPEGEQASLGSDSGSVIVAKSTSPECFHHDPSFTAQNSPWF